MVRECKLCENHDKTAKFTTAPVLNTLWPTEPWSRLAIDIRGPGNTLGVRCRFAIVVIDYFPKWVEVEFAQEVTSRRVVDMLHRLFHREGVPEFIVSDNGSQFISRDFGALLSAYGVTAVRTPVYHPRGNGLVERFNRTLGDFCATARSKGGDFLGQMTEILGAYNSTAQATTGRSPAELLHGRSMRTRLHVRGQKVSPDSGRDKRAVTNQATVRTEGIRG